MLMAAKRPLPVGHPSIERYVCISSFQKMKICSDHPAIHANLVETNVAGYTYPPAHRSLETWASAIPGYPGDHPNVDTELRLLSQYAVDHPNLDSYVQRRLPTESCWDFSGVQFPAAGVCPATVTSWHPSIDASINDPSVVFPAAHTRTHAMLAAWMPATHRCVFLAVLCCCLWSHFFFLFVGTLTC